MNKDKLIAEIEQLPASICDSETMEWMVSRDKVIKLIQSEPEETKPIEIEGVKPCTYCQGKESLSERELEQYSDVYTGFGVDISGGKLLIESCTAVGGPSKDYTFSDTKIAINYCPMCGRKINEKAGE